MRYVEILNNFFCPELQKHQVNISEMRIQQDGATVHTARASEKAVRRKLPGYVIYQFGNVPRLPSSPGLMT